MRDGRVGRGQGGGVVLIVGAAGLGVGLVLEDVRSGAFVSKGKLGGGMRVTEGFADGTSANGGLRDILPILGSLGAALWGIVGARAAPLSAMTLDHLDLSCRDVVSWACVGGVRVFLQLRGAF